MPHPRPLRVQASFLLLGDCALDVFLHSATSVSTTSTFCFEEEIVNDMLVQRTVRLRFAGGYPITKTGPLQGYEFSRWERMTDVLV